MGRPSTEASNAIIYVTYGAFLIFGLYVAWRLRHQSKIEFLASNRTQKGVPLALNFIASALGSGILFTYPEIATIAGVQGLVVYSLSSGLPLMIFGYLGPIIRRKCPDGFVLTEWTRQRFGTVATLWLGLMTLITIFLYMVAELSALQSIVTSLTGLDGLPAVIVECIVTTIYTSMGGFKVSFITDTIQGIMACGVVLISVIAVGAKVNVDTTRIQPSGLLDASLVGWQLIWILPVAILTNDFFLSGLWLRTFASRTDKDLLLGTTLATIGVTIILTLVGISGLLAIWSGAIPLHDPNGVGAVSLFILLKQLPSWVIGIVLVMTVTLSAAAFDSLQSSMVSSASNDLFRNRLGIWWIRGMVVLIIIPVIVVALKSPDILQIYLISDLVSASLVPVLVLGLTDRFYFLRGFELVVGTLGGILAVFIFGAIYYGNVKDGANLILIEGGLYQGDWGAFGAFVAAPFGALIAAAIGFSLRAACQYVYAHVTQTHFDVFDKPLPGPAFHGGEDDGTEGMAGETSSIKDASGKFI